MEWVDVNLGSDRVLNADDTDAGEVGDDSFFVIPVWFSVNQLVVLR